MNNDLIIKAELYLKEPSKKTTLVFSLEHFSVAERRDSAQNFSGSHSLYSIHL